MDMEKKPVLLERDADSEDREPSDSKEIIASLARQFYGMGWFPGKVMGVDNFTWCCYPFIPKILQN